MYFVIKLYLFTNICSTTYDNFQNTLMDIYFGLHIVLHNLSQYTITLTLTLPGPSTGVSGSLTVTAA